MLIAWATAIAGCAEAAREVPASDGAGGDGSDGVGGAPVRLVLGDRVDDAFVPWRQDSSQELVLGVQSGVHISVALQVETADVGDVLTVKLSVETRLAAESVGALELASYPLTRRGPGVYGSDELYVVFEQSSAVFYVGQRAEVVAEVELRSGQRALASVAVRLIRGE